MLVEKILFFRSDFIFLAREKYSLTFVCWYRGEYSVLSIFSNQKNADSRAWDFIFRCFSCCFLVLGILRQVKF